MGRVCASRAIVTVCVVALGGALLRGQDPVPSGAAVTTTPWTYEGGRVGFEQACLDATTDCMVLNIAAHPDDEAARTLVVLRRTLGVRTVTLYSTYGDGGQNAMGREIGAELAALRVRETLAAATHTGVQVRWLGMSDFGFSKTRSETVEVWGREALLNGMLREVELARPDAVFTNHSLDRGHGHHRASRWAVAEALATWCGDRDPVPLFERTDLEHQDFEVDPNRLDPLRGETSARQAHRGYIEHKTQGPWRPHDPLRVRVDRWRLAWPELPEADVASDALDGVLAQRSAFRLPEVRRALGAEADGVEARLRSLVDGRAVEERVAEAGALLAILRGAQRRLLAQDVTGSGSTGEGAVRLARRIDALQRVVLFGSGLAIEAWLPEDTLAAGQDAEALVALHGAASFDGLKVWHGERVGVPPKGDGPAVVNRLSVGFLPQELPAAASPEPQWVDVHVALEVDGVPLQFRVDLPYTVVAPLELRWDRDEVLVPAQTRGERVFSLSVAWRGEGVLEAPIQLGMGLGVVAQSVPTRLTLSPEHREAQVRVRVTFDGKELVQPGRLSASVGEAKAALRLVPADIDIPAGLTVGLVRGPDDTLAQTLSDVGIEFRELDDSALSLADLGAFDTLVLDIRAYHHRPELAEHRERMLQFCRAGGRVLVFYHKPREWNEGPGKPLLAPFAIEVGNLRVTEEDAAVQRLVPGHSLWHIPHAIDDGDFGGWVQERGLNFPTRWDEAWTPLIAMKDEGEEAPLEGALLYTRYGQGDYVYCSLALYRQLRRNHLGAVRLLVNLLTAGER